MSGLDPSMRAERSAAPAAYEESGPGWLLFAGIMMVIVGTLNVIYGIAAIGDSSFFINDQNYILSNLNTWGWVTLIIGIVEILAAFSILRGGQFGRWFGIVAAGLSSIVALLSIPAYPFWSLAIFAVDLAILYGLAVYAARGARPESRLRPSGERMLTSPPGHMRVPSLRWLGRG